MIRKYSYSLILGALLMFSATLANAQDDAAPADAPATDAPAADAATPPQAPAPALTENPDEELNMPRFRWGISGAGGPMLGALRGGAGGLEVRLGAQITEMIGVYAQPILLAGAGADADNDSVSLRGLGLYGFGALAEFDFIDLVFVGIGPEILWGGIGEASSSTTSTSASAGIGPYFALAARVGVALGSKTPKRRSCFTIGIDLQLVIHGENNDRATFMPMLALGYDRF